MKTSGRIRSAALLAGVLALSCIGAVAARAQKSADTMRFPITEAMRGVGNIFTAINEGQFIHYDLFEHLVVYDFAKKRLVPQLAKSWTQINAKTYEFELREGIKFHNGNAFDADDVVGFVAFLTDQANPEAKRIFQGQSRYDWLAGAEKLSPTKVRILIAEPTALDPVNLSLQLPIYDMETMRALDRASNYEATSNGTGPYRLTELDANRGMTAVKNTAFQPMEGRRPAARIGTIKAIFMPDAQTQVANLLAGNLDVVRYLPDDQIKNLTERSNLTVSAEDELNMLYLEFDSVGRTGHKPLLDKRVRRALMMALDRKTMATFVPGGRFAQILDMKCFRSMIGCDIDVPPPPAYDLDGAKKLLTEAGYPNGFEIEITTRSTFNPIAVAASGFWRKIGVEAKIDLATSAVMRKKRDQGQIQAHLTWRPLAANPDAAGLMSYYFYGHDRDYFRDATIDEWGRQGLATFDFAEREKIYQKVFTRINEEAYMLPISSLPAVFVHTTDLVMRPKNSFNAQPVIGDFGWK